MNAYYYLAIAICAEVIATVSMKAVKGLSTPLPLALIIVGYGVAFWMLTLVVRTVPVGVAYAVWAGMGIVMVYSASMVRAMQQFASPAHYFNRQLIFAVISLGALATAFGFVMYVLLLGCLWGFKFPSIGATLGVLAGMISVFLTYYVWKYPLSMHCAAWGTGIGLLVAYLRRSRAGAGELVEPGQLIGLVGDTGRVTGPHLHWEVWAGGIQVDPMEWLVKSFPESNTLSQ